jgi:hypothetical protein
MIMLRPIGSLTGTIAGQWNRDFSKDRPQRVRHQMRQNLIVKRKGRGNKAWRRYESMLRDPAVLIWPDYAI